MRCGFRTFVRERLVLEGLHMVVRTLPDQITSAATAADWRDKQETGNYFREEDEEEMPPMVEDSNNPPQATASVSATTMTTTVDDICYNGPYDYGHVHMLNLRKAEQSFGQAATDAAQAELKQLVARDALPCAHSPDCFSFGIFSLNSNNVTRSFY